jgi:hypothetical protein
MALKMVRVRTSPTDPCDVPTQISVGSLSKPWCGSILDWVSCSRYQKRVAVRLPHHYFL